jgi:hypothetical protein
MAEIQFLEKGIGPFTPFRPRVVQHFKNCQNIVLNGQASKHGRLLRKIPNSFPRASIHRQVRDHLFSEGNHPFVRLAQTDDHIENGGLSSPVGPQQPHHLAGTNFD